MKLSIKQTVAIDLLEDNVTTEAIYGGGAGGGKSALGCYWILKCCLKYPGSRWLLGRSELKILKDTTLKTFFEICGMQGMVSGKHYVYNAQLGYINFFNKSEVVLKDLYQYPSDMNFDSLGSLEITGAFIDECNQITEKAWNIVMSRIRFKLDEFGIVPKLFGTCNPAKNWVYQRFYKPSQDGSLLGNMRFVRSLVTDNPFISHHYIDNLRRMDENSKQRLLYGNWEYDDDPTALMGFESISDLFTNLHVPHGKKHITCDVARYGNDKTVIFVWSGWKVIEYLVLEKSSVVQTANHLIRLMGRYQIPASCVIADDDGIGGGVVDIVHCKGFVNNARPKPNKESVGVEKNGTKVNLLINQSENFNNLKSQCYFKFADYVNQGSVDLSVVTDIMVKKLIIEELEQVKRNDNEDGKKAVLSKDKVKEVLGRSPDFSDALMFRAYFELFRAFTPPKSTLPVVQIKWNDPVIALLKCLIFFVLVGCEKYETSCNCGKVQDYKQDSLKVINDCTFESKWIYIGNQIPPCKGNIYCQ